LLEGRDREGAARLIRERQGDDRGHALRCDGGQRVRNARAPVVSNDGDALETKSVHEIDRVGGERDARPSRGASGERKRVAPEPRSAGTIVRQPLSCSRFATGPQPRGASGQPCSKSTGRPSAGPSSASRSENELRSGRVSSWVVAGIDGRTM
jgi:hypothetical protein